MKWFAMGAYGRQAKLEDWTNGKDFKLFHGPYFSIRDAQEMRKQGCTKVQFRSAIGDFIIDLDTMKEVPNDC